MELKVIVSEKGNVIMFPDIEAAKKCVEPEDVTSGCYEFFLETGRVLIPKIVKEQKKGLLFTKYTIETVSFELGCTMQKDKLIKILQVFLKSVPTPPAKLEAMSLQELLKNTEQWALEVPE